MNEDFDQQFKSLTGHAPLLWQRRLYEARFAGDSLPAVIDLPTGLGKTMVMAIWLIARAKHPDKVPTRLVYVVDRRTVVDQATDLAIKIRDNAKSTLGLGLAISTLRGQLADNREWSRDPIRPAIVIGTVDLIGSALLFSGYRSGYKYRPHEAGLLGMDSLLVLDEAHLSKPFEKLLESIESFNKPGGAGGLPANVKPLKVIRMSATSLGENAKRFKLEDSDLEDTTIRERFAARKTLTIKTLNDKDKLTDKLANAATSLASQAELKGNRIVVFVRRPDDASKIADAIRNHGGTRNKPGPYADSVEVLTGTLRGLERDELVEKPVLKRFLDGDERPGEKTDPVFLVSTSAGEVGMDLNADHMVCDATTIDSFIQRLGRVNRRGYGDAKVALVRPSELPDKSDFEKAVKQCASLLTDGMSLSPQAMADFKRSLTAEQLKAASSPDVPTVELTDILLDNWSMTSIVEPMPGRPEVGPWLRGITEWEPPQTTIAWRAELDLPGFAQLDQHDVEEWFDTHRILTHETLADRADRVAGTLVDRWNTLEESLPFNELDLLRRATVVVDRAGLRLMTVGDFMNRIRDRNGKPVDEAIRGASIILPASFGGIERGKGLLDADAPQVPKDEEKQPADEQAKAREQRKLSSDVADVRGRYREIVESNEQGESESRPLIGGQPPSQSARFALTLESGDDRTLKLVSYVARVEKPDTGQRPQSLEDHVRDVRKRADDLINGLQLAEADPIRLAVGLAADWHDHGKNRDRWQRMLIFPKNFTLPGKPMAKSGGEMRRDPRGYRHEFGSLREFMDGFSNGKLLDSSGEPISRDVFDLAMHLIAAHHGRGRPHFPKGGFDPDAEDRSDEIHTAAIQRFARLQRKYGWWGLAWLENLLRCADQLASAEAGSDGNKDESEGAGK